MKNNLLTAANGPQTSIEQSQRKSTTSSIHSTLLTALLALFLLIVGNSAVLARPTIYGEGLPGLNASGASNWDSNTKEMSAYGEANTYYAEFLNVAATDNNTYRFKIAVNDAGNWWDGAMDSNNTSESMGNVDIVAGNETQISFKMPFAGDVYVFYKSTNADNSKVWIVAVPQNVAAAPNNSGNRRLKTDIMLSGSGWTSEGIKFAKNDAVPTYRHVTSYILPTKKNTETGAIRFEMYYDNGTYISGKDASVRAALSTSTPQRIIYLWDGNKNGSWIAYTLPAYPVRKSGWKLFIEGYNSGNATNLDANGEATVTLSGGSTYQFFIANTDQATTVSSYSSDIKSYPAVHGVNCFGGCYIDESNSSNVSFHSQQVYEASKYGTLVKSVVAAQDLRGVFQVSGSGTKDVTFTFDGGVITINAVDHADVGPKYTVTLHPNNGGSNIVRENVPEGSNSSAAALNLAEVTYGLGTATWYTDVACTTPFTSVTGNMDLYAKWGVSGNYYFVSCLQTANDGGGESGNWSNTYGQKLTCSFIAQSGHMPFEVIKDKDWGQKINGGNYNDMFDNSNSDVTISATNGHMDFTLDAPKKVTVSYNGKVTIKVDNYTFNNSKTWRIKTSWGNGGAAWNYNTVMTNNGTTNATAILHNVPAGQNSFVVTTKDNDNDAMATVGTETFNALYVDTSSPSSGLTWNTTSARRDGSDNFNSTTPQTDNRWRNCSFTLASISDIRITFDGGKIRCDILPKYAVSFNTGEGGSAVASQTVSEGNTASEPNAPTKAGYTFVKWQLSGADYDFSSPVTEDITLDAVWAYKAIESVSLNKSSLTLFENSTPQTLTPSYLPADVVGVTYSWSVSPAGVVSVADGVVSVITPGTATITCTATDEESHSLTATCSVTVHAGEGCVMEEQNIFSHTIWGNSTTGGLASNSLPDQAALNEGMEPTCRKIKMYYGNLYSEFTADENGVVKAKSGLADHSDEWYEIKGGTNANAIDGCFYYLKNVATGRYITRGDGQFGNNADWYYYTAITTPENEETELYQFIYTKKDNQDNQKRICSVWNYSGMNSSQTYGLHRRNQDWAENYSAHCPNPMIVFGRGENQGNTTLNVNLIVVEEGDANPDFLASPVLYNTRSYYRFAQNAAVSLTLDKKLRADDKIVVYCYNPAGAASIGGLYINNNKVSDIDIPANSAIEFEYIAVEADADKNAIEVRSDDNNFCVAAVDVQRSLPAAAEDPALTWSAPATCYTSLVAGAVTFQASSANSSGAITYSSSDETVATVVDGVVTPVAFGTATITASIEQYLCFGESSIQYNIVVEPSLQEAIDATPVHQTLTLTHDYNEDAVINKAITLEAQGHVIGDLLVEQTGDLTLGSALTVRDFTICAKAGNTTIPAASGQVRNANNLTCIRNAYFLYTVDPSGHVQYGWYDFTVPFPVHVMSGIKGIQDDVMKESFANEVDYAVMEYLGAKKAQGQYPYQKFRGVMQPNQLYSLTLDSRYNYNTVRFQKTVEGALVTGNDVTLNAYAGSGIFDNLNGVGNGTLHHADAGNLTVDFVQVYQSGDKTFLTVNKNDYSFVVGTAFMVQETGTMTLSQATHSQLLAPKRHADVQPAVVRIASEGQPFSDQLFISASETGGQAYTPGVDVAKAGELGSANVPQIWTNAYNSSLSVHQAQLINGEASYNLSIYAPADGAYTLTGMNIQDGYTLYLTQNCTILSDLSGTYTLDLYKGITTDYGLLLMETYRMPTAVEETNALNSETRKIIRNGILYILHNGKVYNAQGALME